MKLSRLEKSLGATAAVILIGALTVNLTRPVPAPTVSIEFQGYLPGNAKVFDLVPGTNEYGQFFYGSSSRSANDSNWWFSCLPSSNKFPLNQTDVLCEVYFTNHCPTRVGWSASDAIVEAKTPNGWITNVFGHFTTTPTSFGAAEKDVFTVYVPSDAIEWRIVGDYGYFTRRFPTRLLLSQILDDLPLPGRSEFALDILNLTPEPDEVGKEAFSEFFTNKPPFSAKP